MVREIQRSEDGIGLRWKYKPAQNGAPRHWNLSDVMATVSNPKTTANIAERFEELLQEEIDVRIKRSQLPDDEPTKHTDPASPREFWDGPDLVTRTDIITVEFINGKYIPTVRPA